MNKGNTGIWTIVAAIVLVALVFMVIGRMGKQNTLIQDPVSENPTKPTGEPVVPDESLISVTTPAPQATINPNIGISLSGSAKGNWFFEATAPVAVYDNANNKLAEKYISAHGDWMTTSFVTFSGTIDPFLTHGALAGYVLFSNSNPSDNEGTRHSIKVPVTFSPQEITKIKVYFGNSLNNPNTANCSLVYAVEREVPKTASVGKTALQYLFTGPTSTEKAAGYTTVVDSSITVKSLIIGGGVAIADFDFLPSGGSCLVGQARAQITQTLMQFPTVKKVKILLNGSESEALQP